MLAARAITFAPFVQDTASAGDSIVADLGG